MKDVTTIKVSREFKRTIATQGLKDETYEQILRRLLGKLGIKFSDDGKMGKEAKC